MSGLLASSETERSQRSFVESTTIIEQLESWLGSRPDQPLIHFLPDGDQVSESLTFRRLEQRARAIAARLQQTASPGDRILLVYPPGLEFISAFFGCMTAGMIAVPCCFPVLEGSVDRFQSLGL